MGSANDFGICEVLKQSAFCIQIYIVGIFFFNWVFTFAVKGVIKGFKHAGNRRKHYFESVLIPSCLFFTLPLADKILKQRRRGRTSRLNTSTVRPFSFLFFLFTSSRLHLLLERVRALAPPLPQCGGSLWFLFLFCIGGLVLLFLYNVRGLGLLRLRTNTNIIYI